MKYSYIVSIIIIGIIILFSNSLTTDSGNIEKLELPDLEFDVFSTRGNVRADNNTQPVLNDLYLYLDDDEMVFEVNYTDYDGDEGTVLLYIDDNPAEKMRTGDFEPTEGQYYHTRIPESKIDDYTEFYLTADDNNGSAITLKDTVNQPFLVGDFDGWGEYPELSAPDVYFDGDDWVFNVTYWDPDGDEAEDVYLYINYNAIVMSTNDPDPYEGQNYIVYVIESDVDEETEFYLSVDDVNGSYAALYDDNWEYFVVGDFLGGGEDPILSNPDVYFDGDDWVFNVTYRDSDGDNAANIWLYLDGQETISMDSQDPDPLLGQNFLAYVPKSSVDEETDFYFDVTDTGGGYTSLYDEDWDSFIVGDFLSSDEPDDGDGENGWGFSLPGRWGDPEVIVGIIALVGMGIGSGIGVWFRKKKRKRFSDLLSKIDDVYGSYKTHPRKCETELEKLKAEIDQDLKQSVIDENNYSILKDRINEVTQEIRHETVRSKISDLPKDIELRIKDMLIDGKISKGEYNKFMKALSGSTMKTSDKEEMERLMEAWMKEDKRKMKK